MSLILCVLLLLFLACWVSMFKMENESFFSARSGVDANGKVWSPTLFLGFCIVYILFVKEQNPLQFMYI